MTSPIAVALALAATLATPAAAQIAGRRPPSTAGADRTVRQAILDAEEARAPDASGIDMLLAGARSRTPAIQRLAVRALGRLERPALIPRLIPFLEAASADVRAETAGALAQAAHGLRSAERTSGSGVGDVLAGLAARLEREADAGVRGEICAALGRLPLENADQARRVEGAIVAAQKGSAPDRVVLGAARGFESLARLHGTLKPLDAEAVRWLNDLAASGSSRGASKDPADSRARARRLAMAALTAAAAIDTDVLRRALADPDAQVRRLAALAAGSARLGGGGDEAIATALRDPSPMVRYEALRAYGRGLPGRSCGPVFDAMNDSSRHVSLLALELLGAGCPLGEDPTAVLDRAAADVDGAAARSWHAAAHALVALAHVSPSAASARLAAFLSATAWQSRMYAARAAAVLEDVGALERLATDPHDNVREAAIEGLIAVAPRAGDDRYLDALGRSDYQLIRTAARALQGSPARSRATGALLDALARISAGRRDTSRDPRLAILDRLGEVGTASDAERLVPYLEDFDPRVAMRAAEVLAAWTGRPHEARPRRPQPIAPRVTGLTGLDRVRARITMRGGGRFVLRLRADQAPATATRFVTLARARYYDGLTFHRVVPNFVIQGGSPGANEYVGDGPYMRDEVGLPHVRGAVGISTRGRDTGDAQMFVDLVDNPRLDYTYTVFAEVVDGMDVVDAVVEGATMEKVELRTRN